MELNNKIVLELIDTHFVPNYVRQRAVGWPQEDVVQDVYETLLVYPRLQEIYDKKGINGVRALASGIIVRMLSRTGKAYKLYKKEMSHLDNEIEDHGYLPTHCRWA